MTVKEEDSIMIPYPYEDTYRDIQRGKQNLSNVEHLERLSHLIVKKSKAD